MGSHRTNESFHRKSLHNVINVFEFIVVTFFCNNLMIFHMNNNFSNRVEIIIVMYRALQEKRCVRDSFFSRSKLTVHFTQQQQKESSANSSNIHARLRGQDSTVKEVLMQGKWKGEIFLKKKKKKEMFSGNGPFLCRCYINKSARRKLPCVGCAREKITVYPSLRCFVGMHCLVLFPLSPEIHFCILQTVPRILLMRMVEGIWFQIKPLSL